MAVAVGRVLFVGSAEEARTWCDESTQVVNLGESTIYPGFMEAIKAFVEQNPNRPFYRGGYVKAAGMDLTAALLDEICADKPVFVIALDALHTVENDVDQVNHGIRKHLVSDFVVPLERSSMNHLAHDLDDVSDVAENV